MVRWVKLLSIAHTRAHMNFYSDTTKKKKKHTHTHQISFSFFLFSFHFLSFSVRVLFMWNYFLRLSLAFLFSTMSNLLSICVRVKTVIDKKKHGRFSSFFQTHDELFRNVSSFVHNIGQTKQKCIFLYKYTCVFSFYDVHFFSTCV